MNSNISPTRLSEDEEAEGRPRARHTMRSAIDIVRSNLKSLQFELSKGSTINPEMLLETEKKLKELEDFCRKDVDR